MRDTQMRELCSRICVLPNPLFALRAALAALGLRRFRHILRGGACAAPARLALLGRPAIRCAIMLGRIGCGRVRNVANRYFGSLLVQFHRRGKRLLTVRRLLRLVGWQGGDLLLGWLAQGWSIIGMRGRIVGRSRWFEWR